MQAAVVLRHHQQSYDPLNGMATCAIGDKGITLWPYWVRVCLQVWLCILLHKGGSRPGNLNV
jgi:hypothetical protein